LHQNASNATNQKESLGKIALVESQRSEEENSVLKPVSSPTPDKPFEIMNKNILRQGSKDL